MGKFLKLALGAVAVGAGVKLYKMPNKERADMFSRTFVKAIGKFSNGLPEPVVNSEADDVSSVTQKDLITEATLKIGFDKLYSLNKNTNGKHHFVTKSQQHG